MPHTLSSAFSFSNLVFQVPSLFITIIIIIIIIIIITIIIAPSPIEQIITDPAGTYVFFKIKNTTDAPYTLPLEK